MTSASMTSHRFTPSQIVQRSSSMSMTKSGGGARPLGGAAKWRLAESLTALEGELSARGARLDIIKGDAEETILALAAAAKARTRPLEPSLRRRRQSARRTRRDSAQGARRRSADFQRPAHARAGRTGQARRDAGRHLQGLLAPPSRAWPPARADARAQAPHRRAVAARRAEARVHRSPEAEAHQARLVRRTQPRRVARRNRRARLAQDFRREGAERLTRPSATSLRTAPPRACRRICVLARSRRAASRIRSKAAAAESHALAGAAEKYLAELTWRDFATALLDAHPDMATRALRPEFERFPWRHDEDGFDAWAHGHTGYPIVDAGMRQLWRTGYLPNRARLIVASFLVKHLLIDWRHGEAWFWDTLIDADPANNPLNWQWVAGAGVDSAPYFRIFNPVLQAEKFDPDGAYVRQWVPELAAP